MKTPDRFIVVDDDPINNIICKAVIRNSYAEMDVLIFEYPEKALKYIENEYSNTETNISTILLLDINMPIISGWQFLERYNHFSNTLKNNFSIYILSSSISESDKDLAANNTQVKGYLEKPFMTEKLTRIIADLELQGV